MTNETLETIKSRRSCRAYKPEQITDEELNAVLEAGTYAASAMGRQSAKIVVGAGRCHPRPAHPHERRCHGQGHRPYVRRSYHSGSAGRCRFQKCRAGRQPCHGQSDAGRGLAGAGQLLDQPRKGRVESDEGKALLRQWGIEGDWVGVGHCILGYPAADPKPAAPRKPDYIVKV